MRLLIAVMVLVACGACATLHTAPPRQVLDLEGAVFVYADGRPGVLALQRDGAADVPLEAADSAGREGLRLVAWGTAPAGNYGGLAIEKTGGGSETVPLPFALARRTAQVVMLQPMRSGSGWTATAPARPAAGLVALATNPAWNIVTVFDKLSGAVGVVIPCDRGPSGVALAIDRQRAFVAATGDDVIDVIDLAQFAITDRLRLSGGDQPIELAPTPDGRTLLVVNQGSSTVSFVDLGTLAEVARVTVGSGARGIVVDPAGKRAYVPCEATDSIAVLDLERRTLATTLATDAGPLRAAFDRDARQLFVVHRSSPSLEVIDVATLAITRKVYLGEASSALAVDPDTGRIYVGRVSGGIDVFDSRSLLPVSSIPAIAAQWLVIDIDSRMLYAAHAAAGEVRAVRLVGSGRVLRTDAGAAVYQVAIVGTR